MPQTPVSSASQSIANRVSELGHAIEELALKLQPALRPEPVLMTGAGKPGTNEPCAVESELTLQLRNHASVIENLVCRLNALRERVEV